MSKVNINDSKYDYTVGQEKEEADKKEHLVEGAKLFCVRGSKYSELVITDSDRPAYNNIVPGLVSDCKNENIKDGFGICSKNPDKKCEGFMELDQWINLSISLNDAEKVNGEEVISLNHALLCKKEGVIIPVMSGQDNSSKTDAGLAALRDLYYLRIARAVRRLSRDGGSQLGHIIGGDPIDLNTGEFIFKKTEITIAGRMPLEFGYVYKSLTDYCGCMGEGFIHNYEVYLKIEEEQKEICLFWEDGRYCYYKKSSNGIYEGDSKTASTLKASGKEYLYNIGKNNYYFNQQGLLIRQTDMHGNMKIFDYNENNQLVRVYNSYGAELTYRYNAEGRLIEVNDFTGRRVRLYYRYGKLFQIITLTGEKRKFTYNEDGKLNSIITPRGIQSVYNEYDCVGRVIKQTTANMGTIAITYDDETNNTFYKSPIENNINYKKDNQNRVIAIIDSEGIERYEYNLEGLRTLQEDKNQNISKYEYKGGKLVYIINALNQDVWIKYDKAGNLATLVMEDETAIKTAFDAEGKLKSLTNQLGYNMYIEYNAKGLPKWIKRFDGSSVLLEYDASDNLSKLSFPFSYTLHLLYDDLNRLISRRDGNGNLIQYCYDERNLLIKKINEKGDSRVFEYDEVGNLIKITDYDNNVVQLSYDSHNHCNSLIDKEGNIWKRNYNVLELPEEEVFPDGAKVTYEYNKQGNMIKKTNALGGNITYCHDKKGNAIQMILGNSCMHYVHDALDRITKVIDGEGNETKYRYNKSGLIAEISDAMDRSLQLEYNKTGNLIGWRYNEESRKYAYNEMGQIAEIKDSSGRKIKYDYQEGILSGISYSNGRENRYGYDNNYNIIKRTNQNNFSTYYAYDCQNHMVQWENDYGEKEEYSYDKSGNIIVVIDAQQNKTGFEYTAIGKIAGVTDAAGNKTQYKYDKRGRLSVIQKSVKGEAQEVRYCRNKLEQPVAVIDSMNLKETYEYDNMGILQKKTDKDGNTTEYQFTSMGYIRKISYEDGRSVRYEYNSANQLTVVKDWLGNTNIERNLNGRITAITDHRGKKVSYKYNDYGLQSAIIYPDEKNVNYEYDNYLRLVKAYDDKISVCFSYNSSGLLEKQIYSNGVQTTYKYDAADRLTELLIMHGELIYERLQYRYDKRGNKTQIVKYRDGLPEESGIYEYRYDEVNQLVQVIKDGTILKYYQYDGYGNRVIKVEKGVETSYRYNQKSQLIVEQCREKIKEFEYDGRGNLIKIFEDKHILYQYSFDSMNQLCEVKTAQGSVRYGYNGLGYRVYKETEYKDGRPKSNCEYILDHRKEYCNLLQKEEDETESYIWAGFVIGMEKGHELLFYHHDELNSTIRLSGSTGRTREYYGYGEFGEDIYGNQGGMQPFGYTGYQLDLFSKTYLSYARGYLPEQGRFMSEDYHKGKLCHPITLNPYVYCFNQPNKFIDLDGRFPWVIIPIFFMPFILGGCGTEKEPEPIKPPRVEPQPTEPKELQVVESPESVGTPDIENEGGGYTLEELKDALKEYEGFDETEREHTIGYGHDTNAHEKNCDCNKYYNNGKISKADAEKLLEYDIERLLPDGLEHLSVNETVALITLSFNAGPPKEGDYIYDLLKAGDYTSEELMNGFLRYVKADGVVNVGIIRRRIAEFLYAVTGEMHMDFEVAKCWPNSGI